jgi:hypothetical protein
MDLSTRARPSRVTGEEVGQRQGVTQSQGLGPLEGPLDVGDG